MSTATLTQTIPVLTEPFVRTGLYPSAEKALKHIILDYVGRQIAWAEAELRRYQKKYGQGFAEWTASLSGRATIADEDDWMEWEATRDMLKGWRQVRVEVEQSNV